MERGGNQGRPLTPAVAAMILIRPLRRCARLVESTLEAQGVAPEARQLLALVGAYLDDAVCVTTMPDWRRPLPHSRAGAGGRHQRRAANASGVE